MKKLTLSDIKTAYENPSAVQDYEKAVLEVGLWESERILIEKYFPKEGRILDLGCGVGRTTWGMNKLGYQNIIGLDLSSSMIQKAKEMNFKSDTSIAFVEGNALQTTYSDKCFDGIFFSFNGFMQIPQKEERQKVLVEVKRILKEGGFFIFTTYDRQQTEYDRLWTYQENIWSEGKQDQRLHEFGDLLIQRDGQEIFLHIPTQTEVMEMIRLSGLTWIETVQRQMLVDEPIQVKKFASECIFWVVKK